MIDVLQEWNEILTMNAGRRRGPVRDLIVRSWTRSDAAGLDPAAGALRLRHIPHRELRTLLDENRGLVDAARPHVEQLSTSTPVDHVAYLVGRDGIVLLAAGTDADQMRDLGLTPGYDWSEAAMGTNGAGTALVTGTPVTIFGPEHFLAPLKGFICTAAPVRAPDGTIIGAVDLSTALENGRPSHLLRAIETAKAIEAELRAQAPAG